MSARRRRSAHGRVVRHDPRDPERVRQVTVIERALERFEELTDFTSRLRWLQDRRPDLTDSLLHSQDGDVVHGKLKLTTD